MKKQKSEAHIFLDKVRALLNPKVVRVQSRFENGIVLTFLKSKYQIVISPRAAIDPYYAYAVTSFDNLTLCYDQDYQALKNVINKKVVEFPDRKNGADPTDFYQALISCFKINGSGKGYNKLHSHTLKKEAESHLKLKVDADREYFLYGDDELTSSYPESRGKIKLKANQKVLIKDSAFIFTGKDGTRSIDLTSGINYMDKKFMYLDKDLTKLVTVAEGEKYDYVQMRQSIKNKYLRTQLKAGVDLKKLTNKIAYTKVKKTPYTLIKKGKRFFLKDELGEIRISHPDLKIYLL